MNKTDRKNKTKMKLNWPTTGNYFTIKDLLVINPDFKPITLRVHVKTALEKDKIASVIGHRNQGKGRPEMIMAMNPVSQELLDNTYKEDNILPPDSSSMVKVMDVTSKIFGKDVDNDENEDVSTTVVEESADIAA